MWRHYHTGPPVSVLRYSAFFLVFFFFKKKKKKNKQTKKNPQVRTARQGARQLFEDSPSFLTTRTCAVSNGTGAAAAAVPSSADIDSNDGYSRWPVNGMIVCFNAQFALDGRRRREASSRRSGA